MPKPLIQTTGRRKEAVARVRLRPGTGQDRDQRPPVEQYFTILTHQQHATEALRVTPDGRRLRRRRHDRTAAA